ncbi:MAG: DNA-processing protein DprA [Oscillospiraceae bacterium]|nr:DNA-processing protein DprA [Oscillospiraceae bacterium]
MWLSALEGVSALAAGAAVRHFGSAELCFFAREEELRELPNVKPNELRALADKDLSRANKILADCTAKNYRILTIQDAEYPNRLRNIYDPPVVLYLRGTLPVVDEEAVVALVGTRSCTPYGLRQAENIGYGLARRGLLVVTGLARGVDSASALGALRGGKSVIGVLGCGLDVVYPASSRNLYDDVAAQGALITEYPPGTEALGSHFPVRNRIISGLALGVVIMEAPAKSGALITASRALEQGRDVFALPGNVDSVSSAGSNNLLREGAIPVTGAEDIAREYRDLFPDKIKGTKPIVPLDKKAEQQLLEKQLGDAKPKSSAKREAAAQNGDADSDAVEPEEYIDHSHVPTSAVFDDALVAKLAERLPEAETTVFLAVAAIARANGADAYLDEIIAQTGLAAGDVLSLLTMLEIDGYVGNAGAGFFRPSVPEEE